MAYFSESSLKGFRNSEQLRSYKASFSLIEKSQADVSIFLSHSHKDEVLVEGFIKVLEYTLGISVYVDWLDPSMPKTPTITTAQAIKSRIKEMDFFLVLATKNAMESRWVPWEIGVADSNKSNDHIAIIPVNDTVGNTHGNEYILLYQIIYLPDNNHVAVSLPGTNVSRPIENWLHR